MFKRIGLLILANLAIFIMLSVILTVIQMVFGINFGTMSGKSLNLGTLFVFAMVVGFSGSIISLLMSKTMAKMSMGLQMIDVNNPQTPVERYLVDVVRSEAQKAGLPMPEVGIYDQCLCNGRLALELARRRVDGASQPHEPRRG